jgi:hypothetical protein
MEGLTPEDREWLRMNGKERQMPPHERLQVLAKLTPWPRNVLRHSFSSYHFAIHKNEAPTAAEMGNSPAVIFQHYRALVTPEAAEKFWKLCPATDVDADKVVEFVA